MTYVFILLAVVAWVGFCLQAQRNNFAGCVCSVTMCAIWIAAALWWSGKIG